MGHFCSRTKRRDWLLANRHLWEKGLVGREEELEFARLLIRNGLFAPSHLYSINVPKILETLSLARCRYPGCEGRTHRLGLCNKHRKWVERGHMTENLEIIKKPFERGIYQNPDARCKIPGCGHKPRRNWLCTPHASQVKHGTIDLEGKPIAKNGKISGRYPPGFPCKVCKKATGRISLGFCSTHYNQYIKGQRDIDGMARGVRRCKAADCNRRLVKKGRDFCYRHEASFLSGVYNAFGKRLKPAPTVNQGRVCKTPDCKEPAHCLGLCRLHYSRQQFGYKGPAAYKNVGKTCTIAGCEKPASCRQMCAIHYMESRIHLDEKLAILKDHGYSVKKLAEWTVNKEGKCLELGIATRAAAIKWAWARYRKTEKFPLDLFINKGGYRSAKLAQQQQEKEEKSVANKLAKEERRAARRLAEEQKTATPSTETANSELPLSHDHPIAESPIESARENGFSDGG